MTNAAKDRRRLLIHLGDTVRQINRSVLNPIIDPLSSDQLEPVVAMVASARADYLQALLTLAANSNGENPPKDINELRQARERYEELVAAAGALETMIERGYLDVGDGAQRVAAATDL